jgi:hypothetical protein
MIANFDVDTAQVHVRASRGEFSVDSLLVVSSVGEVRGTGKMSRGADISARFEGVLRDAEPLHEIVQVEQLEGEGTFGGTIEGRADSLGASLNFHLRGLAVDNLSAESMEGTGSLILENGISMASGQTALKGLRQGGVAIDNVSV